MKLYFQKLWIVSALIISTGILNAQTKPLSLREALQLAAKGNRQLQIKWLESQKTAEAVKEARSYLLPSVVVNGSYYIYGERPVIYLRNEAASPKLNEVKFGGRFAFDGNINASYPLLNPELKSNIRLAGFSEKISRYEIKATEEELALTISQLYLTILMNKEQQKVLNQSLLRNEQALNDSRSLFLQGKSLKTDTLSNYISVQNLKAHISALESNFVVLSVQLKQLLGIEDGSQLVFTDTLGDPGERSNVTGAGLSIAWDNRTDVQMQAIKIDKSKEMLHNVRAGFKPRLTAVGQYQVQNQADDLQLSNYRLPRTLFAGIKLTVPIYSGDRLKYKTTQTAIETKQNEIALTDLKSNIQAELISINASIKEAHGQWLIQQQNVGAAQINFIMMNERYRHGLGSRIELTDAELALTKARLNNLQAVYSIRLLELQYKKAMGVLHLN